MERFLCETRLLDFGNPALQDLVVRTGINAHDQRGKILSAYNYVRDSVPFGYNIKDEMPASAVLRDGCGQCNTKGVLFMALLRAVGVPCRIHGFTVDKKLQKGALRGLYYKLSPKELLHSWVEVWYKDKWLNMEGFILDHGYLSKLQEKFAGCAGSFCGYGVATDDFKNPPVDWNENSTYIQKEGIVRDLGVYDSPDDLFTAHSQKLGKFKTFLFSNIVRHSMNRNVQRIRG